MLIGKVIQLKLQEFLSTVIGDQQILVLEEDKGEQSLNENMINCIKYRLSEKEVLHYFIDCKEKVKYLTTETHWKHIRHIPEPFKWPQLEGEDFSCYRVYGDQRDVLNGWSVRFEVSETNQYRFITSDRSYKGTFTHDEFIEQKGTFFDLIKTIKDQDYVDVYTKRNLEISDVIKEVEQIEGSTNYFVETLLPLLHE